MSEILTDGQIYGDKSFRLASNLNKCLDSFCSWKSSKAEKCISTSTNMAGRYGEEDERLGSVQILVEALTTGRNADRQTDRTTGGQYIAHQTAVITAQVLLSYSCIDFPG